MKLKFGNKAIDFRVSTLPTLFGEKIVIPYPGSVQRQSWASRRWATSRSDRESPAEGIVRPYGMVLVTGPTGSGQDRVAIHLPEHPQPAGREHRHGGGSGGNQPAGHQPGQRQRQGRAEFRRRTQVSFLRQDPDIIMVGEIRDLETADIAIRPAQTGPHGDVDAATNDAPTTLTRLLNMGVAPFNIASAVLLITAQRWRASCARTAKAPPTTRARRCSRQATRKAISTAAGSRIVRSAARPAATATRGGSASTR